MNANGVYALLLTLCCLLLSSCQSQQLVSQSGLYDVPLEHSYKVPIDGFWTWENGNPYGDRKAGALYIAPIDVSLVQERFPELSAEIVEQMNSLMAEHMGRMLEESNAANKTQWVLTENADKADVRIDLAVVKLRTQKPLLHIVSMFIGHFTPRGVSNAMDFISKGNITLEGSIRDAGSGKIIFAFKDSNRAKLKFYHKESYQRTGHVDANLQLWAKRIAKFCRECSVDLSGGQSFREKLENRSLMDTIKAHMN